MSDYAVAVIGGGAAGLCAAISAARRGHSVVLCEKNPQLGRKILATGNGRCNLLNEDLREIFYNDSAQKTVKAVLGVVDKAELMDFFKGLGLRLYSSEGRIFPITNQAASVLKVLEMELKRLLVQVELSFECTGISFSNGRFSVTSRGRQTLNCGKLILAGGGKSYPALGSNGSLWEIARELGHTIIEPVPSAVPLVVKDGLCQILQGQRIAARARSIIEDRVGNWMGGELLFTKYGLSGTCILDISRDISVALNRQHATNVGLKVDMLPFFNSTELGEEIVKRRQAGQKPEEMLAGLLPNKIGLALKGLFAGDDPESALKAIKDRPFKVAGTRGWNEAEFTAGGIDLTEVDALTLQSKIQKDLYFAGEMLDVDGARGGYNLAWAWASGLLAGQTL